MISATPLAYFAAALLGRIIASLYYRQLLIVYEQRIADYKERLNLAPKETAYEKLTNGELKYEISKLTEQMREFGEEHETATRRWVQQGMERPPELDIRQWHEQRAGDMTRLMSEYNRRFQKEFSGKAIAILHEIRIRIPSSPPTETLDMCLRYGMLAGVNPVGTIAT